jgi:hypothetical protein
VFLLLLGLFHRSVDAFEAATNEGDDRLRMGDVGVSDWRANLARLLASNSFSLKSLARRIGVSTDMVAAEARQQNIRVPLPKALSAKLGQKKIESIRSDLQAGMRKNEVQKKHRANGWEIERIELDTPGIHDSWKNAVAERIRDEHRRRVIDLKATHPNASRSTLQETSPGTHRYMLHHDIEWFDEAIPASEIPLPFLVDSSIESHPNWKAELQQLLAMHAFKIAAVVSRVGISQERILAEALRQNIHVPLSDGWRGD